MSERSWKDLVIIFKNKGLFDIMDSQARNTVGENVPMSPTCLRSPRKVSRAQPQS